jgi:hypothetical protein
VGSYILRKPSRRSPETPPVHCITAEDSSRGLSLISAGPLLFTCSAHFHLLTCLCTISLENTVHDFVEQIRGVNVVRRGIWIPIIDFIQRAGTVIGMIIALVITIVYWDENFAERTGIEDIWPFIG